MSDYRIYSPVDIRSNGATAPGEVDIYNGTTNYTALKAPTALAANIPFTLSSTAGALNDYIQTNGAGGVSFAVGRASVLPINMNLTGTSALLPASIASPGFTIMGRVLWRGIPTEGTPSAVRVILSGTAGGARVRLIEVGSATVAAIVTGIAVTATPTVYNVPITGGFSNSAVAYTIEGGRTGGGTLNIWSLQIKP